MRRPKSLLWVLVGLVLFFQPCFLGQDGPGTQVRLAEPYHQAHFPALLQGGFKYWDKGYLVTYALDGTLLVSPNKPGVLLYDKYVPLAREGVVWLNGACSFSVGEAAVSQSGQLVVSGGTENEKAVIANFIAEIGSDDRVHKVIRTSPFMPVYVCALEDGTVWSYGIDRDNHLNGIQNSLRLRHYSFEKGQLHALFDPSTLSQDWLLDRRSYSGAVVLRCNSKTVVLYNGESGDLVEIDLRTDSLKITKVAPLPAVPE